MVSAHACTVCALALGPRNTLCLPPAGTACCLPPGLYLSLSEVPALRDC